MSQYNKSRHLFLMVLCVFFFLCAGRVDAQVSMGSEYVLQKGVVSSGGGTISSGTYSVYGAAGQSSPIGDNASSEFSMNTGFLDDSDLDGDGVLKDRDACPLENSTGFDADVDGCIDTLYGLANIVTTLADDVLSDKAKTSLVSKVEAAIRSSDSNKINTAVNQLNAFINEVNAQKGKKVRLEVSDLLIRYTENIIAFITL